MNLKIMRLMIGIVVLFTVKCFGDPLSLPAAPPYFSPIANPWAGSWIYYTTDSISGLQYLNGITTNSVTNVVKGIISSLGIQTNYSQYPTNFETRTWTNLNTWTFDEVHSLVGYKVDANYVIDDNGLLVGAAYGSVTNAPSIYNETAYNSLRLNGALTWIATTNVIGSTNGAGQGTYFNTGGNTWSNINNSLFTIVLSGTTYSYLSNGFTWWTTARIDTNAWTLGASGGGTSPATFIGGFWQANGLIFNGYFNSTNITGQIATSVSNQFSTSGVVTNGMAEFAQFRVDKNGNNSTGVRGRMDLPSLTISNAANKSSDYDLVSMGVSTFNENGMTNNRINFYFPSGGGICYTSTVLNAGQGQCLFGDFGSIDYNSSGAVSFEGFPGRTNNVTGNGDFQFLPRWDSSNPFSVLANTMVWLNSSNDVFTMEFNSIVQTNLTIGGTIFRGGGIFGLWQSKYVNIEGKRAIYYDQATGTSFLFWGKGEADVHIDSLIISNATAILIANDVSASGNSFEPINTETWLRYSGETIQQTHVGGGQNIFLCPQQFIENNSIDGVSIRVTQMINDGDSAFVLYQGCPKLYVEGLKLATTNSSNPIFLCNQDGTATNQVWITEQKLQDCGGGFLGCLDVSGGDTASQGVFNYFVGQYQELASSFVTGFRLEGGTHFFHDGGNMILPNGRGMYAQGSAKVVMDDFYMDTSRSNSFTNVCIYLSGTPSITLNGGSYISSASALVIDAANTVTITANNCPRFTGKGIGENVTISGEYNLNGTNFFGSQPPSLNGSAITNISPSSLNYNAVAHTPVAVTLTGSVFNYTNTTPSPLECFFSGSVAYAVTKHNSAVFGSLAGDGYFILQPTNYLAITYTVAPTFFTNAW